MALNGKTTLICDESNINTFAVVNPTMELGFGSVITGSRLLMDITVPAGVFSCRFAAFSLLGHLVLAGNFNDIGAGSNIESVAVGITLTGVRNTMVGLHFDGVGIPIQELAGGDFNLADAINGFGASVFPVGASSVLGTFIP